MRPTLRTLFLHGGDILKSPGMQIAKENMQHGSVSVFEHSVCVALVCLWLVHRLHLKVNQRGLMRRRWSGRRCCTIISSTIGTRPTPRTGCTAFGMPERLCAMPTATLS